MDVTPYLDARIAPRAVFDELAERRTAARFMVPRRDGDWRAVTWRAFAEQIRERRLSLLASGANSAGRPRRHLRAEPRRVGGGGARDPGRRRRDGAGLPGEHGRAGRVRRRALRRHGRLRRHGALGASSRPGTRRAARLVLLDDALERIVLRSTTTGVAPSPPRPRSSSLKVTRSWPARRAAPRDRTCSSARCTPSRSISPG